MENIPNNERPSLSKYYISIAEAVSARSTCLKKHYGAVIVKNSKLVSSGYNNPPSHESHCVSCSKIKSDHGMNEYLSCLSVHAEMNSMLQASKEEMEGATLYLASYDVATGEWVDARPCEICLRLIKNSGISTVINSRGIIYQRNSSGVLEACNTDKLEVN